MSEEYKYAQLLKLVEEEFPFVVSWYLFGLIHSQNASKGRDPKHPVTVTEEFLDAVFEGVRDQAYDLALQKNAEKRPDSKALLDIERLDPEDRPLFFEECREPLRKAFDIALGKVGREILKIVDPSEKLDLDIPKPMLR